MSYTVKAVIEDEVNGGLFYLGIAFAKSLEEAREREVSFFEKYGKIKNVLVQRFIRV